MKHLFLIAATIGLFWLTACSDPGTLGSVGEIDLNVSSIDVGQRVDNLLEINPYKIKAEDTVTVNWWKDGGYDFLTYRCINIRKRLYMIIVQLNQVLALELTMTVTKKTGLLQRNSRVRTITAQKKP